jgi:cell wall-associated NlpC family hydrolase
MTAIELAEAAEAFEGAPFRLHGRNPATGLDCIGVLASALHATGCPAPLPAAYSVRTSEIPGLADIVRACGFGPVSGVPLPGDVVLVRIGPCQFHLLIGSRDGLFVHAHAGLGRVVKGPLSNDWSIFGHWRLDMNIQG